MGGGRGLRRHRRRRRNRLQNGSGGGGARRISNVDRVDFSVRGWAKDRTDIMAADLSCTIRNVRDTRSLQNRFYRNLKTDKNGMRSRRTFTVLYIYTVEPR